MFIKLTRLNINWRLFPSSGTSVWPGMDGDKICGWLAGTSSWTSCNDQLNESNHITETTTSHSDSFPAMPMNDAGQEEEAEEEEDAELRYSLVICCKNISSKLTAKSHVEYRARVEAAYCKPWWLGIVRKWPRVCM